MWFNEISKEYWLYSNIKLISVYLENIIKYKKLNSLLTLYVNNILMTGYDNKINKTIEKLKNINEKFQRSQPQIKLLMLTSIKLKK
jgi:hypothetical protein